MDDKRSSPEIARSQKIESLIKKVAENKTLARLNTRYAPNSPQNLQVVIKRTFLNLMKIYLYLFLQVCDGIVRSKLPIFDKTKRQNRNRLPFDQHGFVKVCKNLAMCFALCLKMHLFTFPGPFGDVWPGDPTEAAEEACIGLSVAAAAAGQWVWQWEWQ